jgi:hypothetical protein
VERFGRYTFLIPLVGIFFSTLGAIAISGGPTSSIISREIPIQTPYSVFKIENRTRELESGEFVVGTDSYNTRRLVVDLTNKDPGSDRIVYSFEVKEGSIDVYILDSGNYTLWAKALPNVPETRLDDVAKGVLEFLPKSSGTFYLIYDNASSSDPKTSKSVSDSGKESWTVTAVETQYRTEYKTEVEAIYDYGRVYDGYGALLSGLTLLMLGSIAILKGGTGIAWRIGRPSALRRKREREMLTRVEPRPQPTVRIVPVEAPPSIDNRVFDYIAEHEGVISLSRASNELGISMEELKASIERLKKEGKLE